MKQFCKKFSKKNLDDEKDYLCLKLRKITKKETKEFREYLNRCIADFRWADEKMEKPVYQEG